MSCATHLRTSRTAHPAWVVDGVYGEVYVYDVTVMPLSEREPSDIPLMWEGAVIAVVRPAPLHGALDRLIESVEREFGSRLANLSREDKQRAVRLLDEAQSSFGPSAVIEYARRSDAEFNRTQAAPTTLENAPPRTAGH